MIANLTNAWHFRLTWFHTSSTTCKIYMSRSICDQFSTAIYRISEFTCLKTRQTETFRDFCLNWIELCCVCAISIAQRRHDFCWGYNWVDFPDIERSRCNHKIKSYMIEGKNCRFSNSQLRYDQRWTFDENDSRLLASLRGLNNGDRKGRNAARTIGNIFTLLSLLSETQMKNPEILKCFQLSIKCHAIVEEVFFNLLL